MSDVTQNEWPLWEVFVRSKTGLDHKHCGSLHAADPKMAIQMARDVYTRRQEGTSVWVVRSDIIVDSDPGDQAMNFDPMEDKVYRHPTFYKLPPAVDHMQTWTTPKRLRRLPSRHASSCPAKPVPRCHAPRP